MLRYGQTPKKQVSRPPFNKNWSKCLLLYNILINLSKMLILSIIAKQKLFYPINIFLELILSDQFYSECGYALTQYDDKISPFGLT